MSDASTATSRLIGEIFVERGLVTAEQLESALDMQLRTGDRLGEILVGHFGVPRLELASVLAEQWSDVDRNQGVENSADAISADAPVPPSLEQVEREVEEIDRRPIGEIFVQGGFITAEELERALNAQRETGQRLGEVLVAQGSITRLELASALAEQWAGLPKLRPPGRQSEAGGNGSPEATGELEAVGGHTVAAEQPAPAVDAPVGAEFRKELERQREALDVVRDSVQRPDEQLDALAAQLDELSARMVSSAELDALRSELAALAARPAGDPALTTRLDDLAVKVHAIGDMEALRSALAERVEDLAVRVHEIGALDGDLKALRASIDDLRARAGVDEDARARLDQLASRLDGHGATPMPVDAPLAARLEQLEERVSKAAGADDVREAFGAVREEMREVAAQFDEVPDLEAVTRRLDAIDARLSDSSEQHKIRTAISDLQAELAALGGRDERGKLESVVERLDALEGRVPSQSVLDTLRDDVAGLLAHPAVDPALGQRVDELAARLGEHAAVATELAGLRATVETLSARTSVDEDARLRLEELARQVHALAERPIAEVQEMLVPRLDDVERRLALAAASEDVREAFAAVREEMREVAVQIEELPAPLPFDVAGELEALRGSLVELAARPVADPALATRLEELASRVETLSARTSVDEEARLRLEELARHVHALAERPAAEIHETLVPRLDEVERRLALAAASEDVREAFAALREEMREVAAQMDALPLLDGIAQRLDALELRVADRAEIQTLRSSIAALHAELQALAGRDDHGRFDSLHARIDQLEQTLGDTAGLDALRADLELLRTRTAEPAEQASKQDLHDVRSRLDELEALLASSQVLDDLRSELETVAARPAADPALAGRLDNLATRVEELAGEVARNDDVAALRHDVAQLELRPAEDPALAARLEELAQRADTWQASAEGVRELRLLVADLDARPSPDPTVPHRLAELEGRLDEVANVAFPRDELAPLRDAVARLEQRPVADPDLTARVSELADRVDTLSAAAASSDELHGLRESIARLDAKPDLDPDLPARLGALSHRVDLLEPASQRVDELSARVEELASGPAGNPALAGRIDELEKVAAAAARDVSELEATLVTRLHEAIADTVGQAETSAHELELRVEDVLARLGALDELAHRADGLEADSRSLRHQLTELAENAEGRERALGDTIERVATDARADHERLGAAIDDLTTAATARDERLYETSHELGARIDAVAAHAPADEQARAEIAELRETLSTLAASLDELAGARAHEAEQAEFLGAELGARIDDLAHRVADGRAEVDEVLLAELSQLAARLEESDAAGIVARDESRAELERLAASIGWRLDRVEEVLSAGEAAALRQALADVEQRLEAQEARQAEQVSVTERALRKGLASLGDRLTESEAEYLQAGNALRRSIERLGSAIVEADVAAAERGSEETLALHHANATSYVAFAPTADGYRLVAVEGRPPEIGAHVELPQCEGELVVTRLGASPIPLDTRPCAYLERA